MMLVVFRRRWVSVGGVPRAMWQSPRGHPQSEARRKAKAHRAHLMRLKKMFAHCVAVRRLQRAVLWSH